MGWSIRPHGRLSWLGKQGQTKLRFRQHLDAVGVILAQDIWRLGIGDPEGQADAKPIAPFPRPILSGTVGGNERRSAVADKAFEKQGTITEMNRHAVQDSGIAEDNEQFILGPLQIFHVDEWPQIEIVENVAKSMRPLAE